MMIIISSIGLAVKPVTYDRASPIPMPYTVTRHEMAARTSI